MKLKLSGHMIEVPIRTVGNNGNQLADILNANDLLRNDMPIGECEKEGEPFMVNPLHLTRNDFWEEFVYRAQELGFNIIG